MPNTDVLLQTVIFVLMVANLWIVFIRDDQESVTCTDKSNQDTNDLSQCDISFLPDKCSSLLKDVDFNKGLILGQKRQSKVFLTVGVAVWDDHVGNIRPTLSSLIKHVTRQDTSDVIIVISVSQKYISTIQRLVKQEFSHQVHSGLIHLVSPTLEYVEVLSRRPPLDQLEIKEFSQEFRSKIIQFSKNLGFLLSYSNRISDFVLHISDNTIANRSFLPEIKKQVQKNNHSLYFAIAFSDWNMYPSTVLQTFSEFYAMFGLNSLPNIVYHYKYARQSRGSIVDSNTQLFSITKEHDNQRPNAILDTSLVVTDQEHTINRAYSDEPGFFWSLTPKPNDYIQVTFQNSIKLSRVLIVTGTPLLRDIPSKAVLMACAQQQEHSSSCDLDNCQILTRFGDPIQDIKNLQEIVSFHVKCLRIEFISKGDSWVIIRDISVWTDGNKKT